MVKFEKNFGNILITLVIALGLLQEVCCENKPAHQTTKSPGDTAKEMCKQYSKFAYEPPGSTALNCPIEPANRFITNKTIASEGEFPHTMQLGYIKTNKTKWVCGGILISPTFILTVGHCITAGPNTLKFARGGITDLNQTQHAQIRNITRTFSHPSSSGNERYTDLGLVEVDRAFDLNPFLRPACLYTQLDIPGKTALTSSYGRRWLSLGDFDENKLLKVTLDFFSNAECNNFYKHLMWNAGRGGGIDEASMICAGTKTDRNSCLGISGYPLMLVHPDTEGVKCMYDVIGITSFGIPCTSNDRNKPTVYMRVSNFIEWIEKLVWD